MLRLALVVVPLLVLVGCQKENSAFCQEHPGEQGCPGDASNGGPCKSNDNCTDNANFPVCDTTDNGGTCVLCTATDHAACTGVTPACPNHACVACANDNDCGTDGVCLPTGACAASNNIIHVSATGVPAGSCGAKNQPCSLANALGAVDAMKNVIKIDDSGTYTNSGAGNFNVTTNVTIVAGNATLHKNVDGQPILSISDNTSATIVGGIIEGAHAPNGDGIRCGTNSTLGVYGTIIQSNETFGIDAGGCNSVTLSRSQILLNKRGGINVTSGTFAIVGNVFLNNGDMNNSTVGGIFIGTSPDTMNRLEFNSVSGNRAQVGNEAGVRCSAGTDFVARSNIIWNNGNTGNLVQIGGGCKHAYSDIGPMALVVGGLNDGGNNLNVDPMFTADLHLMPNSMVLKKADPQADLTGIAAKDIDGDMRVKTANMGADMGADQVSR